MKKYFYLICSLALTFTACDPMEDVYEELDALNTESDRTVALTLSADDYKVATKTTYFLSEADAAEKVPAILDVKYPHLENGTVATVTYNSAVTVYASPRVSVEEAYTVTEEDYAALKATGAIRFSNFDSPDDIVAFLNYKYPNPENMQLAKLTYDWYYSSANPSTTQVTDHFFFVNGNWEDTYVVTEEDYLSVNHSRFTFSSSDGANLPLYLGKFLDNAILGAEAGDVQYVSYAYYSSSSRTTTQRITTMAYDGTKWYELDKTITEPATLNFSKQAGVWVPDLSIRYTLVGADYAWIGQQPVGDAAAIASLVRYSNFDTQLWSRPALVKALGTLLKNKFPNAEAGQKFKVSYIMYSGGASVQEIVLVLGEDGEYAEAQ